MHPQRAARIVLVLAALALGAGALTLAQAPSRGDWLLVPQLVRGQEFTYSGSYTEETVVAGVRRPRTFRLESTLLVLDGKASKWDVAFLTVLSLRNQLPGQPPGPNPAAAPPSSVRLEVAEVDGQGRVRSKSGGSLLPPLDGPPTAECGALVEVPRSYLRPGDTWPVAEPGQPTRVWQVAGIEAVNNSRCVKLVGLQQSEDWEHPRADRASWRRTDTVWLSPLQGVACKVKRVLERREAAREAPTYRAVVEYDRDGVSSYPGPMFDACCREIEHAVKFQREAEPLLRQPALYHAQIDALLRRIAFHLQQPLTVGAYRKAVVQVQRRVEAARRGEATPDPGPHADPGPVIQRAVPGQRVPDFVVPEVVNHQSVQLYRHLGKPVLLLFYNPQSEISRPVLRFAQELTQKYSTRLTVLALAVSGDEEQAHKQHDEMHLSFPVLDGSGLHQTFGVDGTPRLVVLDGDGIFRGGYTGWGAHTPREVTAELERWLPR
jgi:peroxiredoxin